MAIKNNSNKSLDDYGMILSEDIMSRIYKDGLNTLYANDPFYTTSISSSAITASSLTDAMNSVNDVYLSKNKVEQITDRLLAIEKKLDIVFRDKSYEEEFPYIRDLFEKYEEESKKLFDRYSREVEKAKTFKAMKEKK